MFFNARFYYPVFTVLFLDFGLTLEQFALLNVVWAGTIVVLEVPSGALADTLGRRKLLVSAGVLMVVEMALLRHHAAAAQPALGKQGLENLVFMKSIEWFPWYFLLALAALLVFSQMHLRHSEEHKRAG